MAGHGLAPKMFVTTCVSCRSCGGLAGESPVGVAAKRARSWWPAEGEIRLLKRHDKVALGGEQVIGPYERKPVSASLDNPWRPGKHAGAEPGM